MRRRTFDVIASWVLVLLTVVLVAAGAVLLYAHAFVADEVKTQLVAQKIVFPAANSKQITSLPPDDAAQVNKYAGETMSTGAQAKVYADNYVAVHLNAIGGGKTYSELSSQLLQDPTNQKLQAQVDSVFKGETIRGLLLNAYAFGTMGQIALWAAIGCFVGAAIMLVLAVLGFLHVRRTSPDEELLGPSPSVDTSQS